MFKFLPIGGVGQIGGNISYVEIDETPFLIDTGILFPREESLGIDHLFANLDALENEKPPRFLLLTHAHEDHIGGLKYIVRRFPQIPIVCSPYTAAFINKKYPKISNEVILYKDFDELELNFFKLRHSIPGVYGFFYKFKKSETGILFCTDFRYDPNERDSEYLNPSLIQKFSTLCKKRYLFLDCTNIASSKASSLYEPDLLDNLESEISNAKKDCYVALFPSNTKRLDTLIKIGNKLKKPVLLNGLSVNFNYTIGVETQNTAIISHKSYEKENSIILLSGSQGDLRGAFRRVFSENDKNYKPQEGDTLLYSSKIIPGNEKMVYELFNKASQLGLTINKGTNPVIHSSGHAYSDEINAICESFKATDLIPIHLEHSFFQDVGNKIKSSLNIHKVENYSELFINNSGKSKISVKEAMDFNIIVEGGSIVDKSVINNRRRLGINGICLVSINKEKRTVMTTSYGVPELDQNKIDSEVTKLLVNDWNSTDCDEKIRIGLRHFFAKEVGYKPQVFVHLL